MRPDYSSMSGLPERLTVAYHECVGVRRSSIDHSFLVLELRVAALEEWFNVCTGLLAFCSADPEKAEQACQGLVGTVGTAPFLPLVRVLLTVTAVAVATRTQ